MTTEILIIGGGVAGSAAAIQLAQQDKQVMLGERERTPQHKVCGEFLSGEALQYLAQLGVDISTLCAVPLDRVRMAGAGKLTEEVLPFAAMSLTRRCLDGALISHAERAGVVVRRGATVERLLRAGDVWQANFSDGDTVLAKAVFLASGKHDVRGYPRGSGKQGDLVAFKMYWQLNAEQKSSLGQSVELITYGGGYAGLQPVEDGLANLCCLIQADQLRRFDGKWDGLLHHMRSGSPHLRKRLEGAVPMLPKPLTIAALPYGFVREGSEEGLWYVGDQAAVIPSFTGDGMSLALHSARLAVSAYIQGTSADEYQRKMASQVKRQVRFATALSRAIVSAPRAAMWVPKLWPKALGVIARHTRIADEYRVS